MGSGVIRPTFSTRTPHDVVKLRTYCELVFSAIIPAQNVLAGAQSVLSVQSILSADNMKLKNIAHFLHRLQQGLNVKNFTDFKNLELIGLGQDPASRDKSEYADHARYFLEQLGCKFAYNRNSELIIGLKREIEDGTRDGLYSYKKGGAKEKAYQGTREKPQPHHKHDNREHMSGFDNDPTPRPEAGQAHYKHDNRGHMSGFDNEQTPRPKAGRAHSTYDRGPEFVDDPTPVSGFSKADIRKTVDRILSEVEACRQLIREAILVSGAQSSLTTQKIITALETLGRRGNLEDIDLIMKIGQIDHNWQSLADEAVKSIIERFNR